MSFYTFLILTIFLISGCIAEQGKITVDLKRKGNNTETTSISRASVSSVKIINNQLVIHGQNLSGVEKVKINGASFSEMFAVESKSATQIIANSLQGFSVDVSKVFDLVLSSANASATFQIDFNLCNATLYGKGFDCVGVTNIQDKDVLAYDAGANTWVPTSLNDFSYQGTLDASGVMPSAGAAGEYYIISVAGNGFGVGDWAVSNGTTFDQINNSTTVTKVFNRTGDIDALEGDYDLNKLADVTLPVLTGADAGKILKFNGTQWVLSDDLSGGGAGSVVTTSIANSAVTDAKIDSVSASKITGTINSTQILDGTIVNADISATAAIDYSKLNIPNTSIPYAKLNIADGDIPASKISGLPSGTAVLATSISDGDTTHAPDGNSIFDALAGKIGVGGGTLTAGTINGVPTPVGPSEIVNKDYVDDQDALLLLKAGGTLSGLLTLDADLKIKGGANYVTLKAHAATTADYDFVFPQTKGTNGYVLSTDGNGNTSWVADSTGAGAFSGAASRAVATGAGGALEVSVTTATELGYVNGVTSSIQTQLNAKEGTITAGTSAQYYRGDKTWQTLDTSVVPEGSRLYFTEARAIASPLTGVASATGVIDSSDTILGAFGKLINTQNDYVSKTGNSTITGTLTINTIVGALTVPDPINPNDAANRKYVDGYGQWTKSGSDVTRSTGNVGIGTSSPNSALDVVGNIINTGNIGASVPAGSIILMNSCPAGWTDRGILSPGPPGASCGGTLCSKCESPASSSSLIPTSSILLMENCPNNWTYISTAGGPPAAGFNVSYSSCQSPASPVSLPPGSRLIMSSCPTGWNDLGETTPGPLNASCGASSCRACEVPGSVVSTQIQSSSGVLALQPTSGNVGIGTILPNLSAYSGTTLSVASAAVSGGNIENITLAADGEGVIVGNTSYVVNTNTGATDKRVSQIRSSTEGATALNRGGNLAFWTKANGAAQITEKMRIDSNGFVGIGTASPNALLELASSTSTGLRFTRLGYDTYEFQQSPGQGLNLRNITDSRDELYLDGAGNVGIGVTTLSYKLHVNGSVAGVGAYVNASDVRFKKDITPVKSSLDRLTSLEGVYYNWKQDEFPEMNFGKKREMGVIAQKVEKVFPEAVTKDSKGFRSVAYSMLIAPIIESIKEIKNWLIDHDKKIADNNREIASLKSENEAMKSYLCSRDANAPFCAKSPNGIIDSK